MFRYSETAIAPARHCVRSDSGEDQVHRIRVSQTTMGSLEGWERESWRRRWLPGDFVTVRPPPFAALQPILHLQSDSSSLDYQHPCPLSFSSTTAETLAPSPNLPFSPSLSLQVFFSKCSFLYNFSSLSHQHLCPLPFSPSTANGFSIESVASRTKRSCYCIACEHLVGSLRIFSYLVIMLP